MHLPVLLNEAISYLAVNPVGTYVDGTVGGGGHLQRLLQVLRPEAKVLALDKDPDTLAATSRSFQQEPRVVFVHEDFRHLDKVLANYNITKVDGVLLDLGVSSFQLDIEDRGFSFHDDARLDMRMNRHHKLSAWDVVNNYDQADLTRILYQYGEEKYASSIARRIIKARQDRSIDTTLELVELIKSAVPPKYRREKHPARKTFQALRIEVNDELGAVEAVLPQAVDLLRKGGRLCVITFHSLEDRLVKRFMQWEARQCICPPELPICTCNHQARLEIITRKPILPSAEECQSNPRARSAKLRVAGKI
ncbi:MAG: 16S rRNA (cytosine(1402)-N(4))-methyltransferase RsmH [Syntrophomonadaceae bacterium]|nr:16S rRNA (cytosine(1402)-N(4))-methyltransferase RsmH [Syntrophomonadaceae bacterium]